MNLSHKNTDKVALKLHKQFAHATAKKVVDLVRNAGVNNKKLENSVHKVCSSCDVCKRFRKPTPRPVVGFSIGQVFNEAISMDLKSWEGSYFFVIIDIATRYCTATLISNKLASTIIKKLFTSWIVLFGAPKKILSDNGCEFNNSMMRDLGENFNIKIMTTSAESPWSNGVCERQNAVLGDSVRKIMDDSNCSVEVALAWAVAARNSLSNHSGFSPNQLVFGRNPALPNVFTDKPPAVTLTPSSETVRLNLNAMRSAREDFVRAEASEKLRRALRHNIRETEAHNIELGSQVYYKRNDSYEWYGPGVVIGKDGKQFLVRHGGVYYRVHACRLTTTSVTGGATGSSHLDAQGTAQGTAPVNNRNVAAGDRRSDDDSDEEINFERNDVEQGDAANSIANTPLNETEEREEEPSGHEVEIENAPSSAILPQPTAQVKIKSGQRFKGILHDSGEVISGRVLGRAGKAKGQYKDCFNIEKDTDGSLGWVDFGKDFSEWQIVADDVELLVLFNSDEVMVAKMKEIENWDANEVYEEVENIGQATISVRWVVTSKIRNDKPIIKARLVARGFEEHIPDLRKDSPTCSKESVRLVLAFASAQNWSCQTIDVKSAYLQGNNISRDVFLRPPPEFDNGMLWKLKKTIYGLSDAARQWYLRVKDELTKLGVTVSSLDAGVFFWSSADAVCGVICLYVDDFLWAGTKEFKSTIIDKLSQMFLIGSCASKAFKYIGLNIEEGSDGSTFVDQFDYGRTLRSVDVSSQRSQNKTAELSEKEKGEFRALLGQLNWIATHTRPDIAFDVCELSVGLNNSTVGDLMKLNKVIRRVTSDNIRLHFPKLQSLTNCSLECFSDASFANLPGGGSQGGFIIFLQDSRGYRCPIVWQSRKIQRVVKSTLAAETLALVECAETAVYIKEILSELSGWKKMPINCYVDNKSLFDSLNSTKNVDNRRLRIDLAVLSDMIDRRELNSVKWVDTTHQLADCLTKKGASAERLRAAITRD